MKASLPALDKHPHVSIGSTIYQRFSILSSYTGKYSHGQLIYPAKGQPEIPSVALIT